jgi:putative transposase
MLVSSSILTKVVQYGSHEFQTALAGYKMESSMSRRCDCWDNAPTESFWGHLKVGRLYGRTFETRRQAIVEVMPSYKHRRIPSTLAYAGQTRFEESWLTAQPKKAAQ